MNLHKFSPLVVFETEIKGSASLLKALYPSHSFDDETGMITGELNGKVLVHKDPSFAFFFKAVKEKVKEYLGEFQLKEDLFDLNIVKSWYTVCGPRYDVPSHYHSCSHISFVYYIDIKENDPLFFTLNNPNEWFGDAFTFTNSKNEVNSLSYSVQPKKETLLIFPGNVKHYTNTSRNERDYKRMCISGDVVLTLKENMLKYESGLLPNKYWG